MTGIAWIVDLHYLGEIEYSIEDLDSSPHTLAERIVDDLRERYPDMVMYDSGFEVDAESIEDMDKGDKILVWEDEESSVNDDGSHTVACITCTSNLTDWIEENIGSPSEAWGRWVGSQTPQEFLNFSPNQSVEDAVDEYVDEIMRDKKSLAPQEWIANYSEIREALCHALASHIEDEGVGAVYTQD